MHCKAVLAEVIYICRSGTYTTCVFFSRDRIADTGHMNDVTQPYKRALSSDACPAVSYEKCKCQNSITRTLCNS